MAAGCAALSFLAVSDHRSRARDKNLATLNKGTTNQGHDNRPTQRRGADFSAHADRARSLVRSFVRPVD